VCQTLSVSLINFVLLELNPPRSYIPSASITDVCTTPLYRLEPPHILDDHILTFADDLAGMPPTIHNSISVSLN
jgi:hypothetical protein